MAKNEKALDALEKLSLFRELLIPAFRSGIKLTTTDGQPVTPDNLPRHFADGAMVRLVADGGRLALAAVADDDPRQPRCIATCEQIHQETGRKVRLFLIEGDPELTALDGYQPEALRLGEPLLSVKLDDYGRLHRVAAKRAPGQFRDKMVTAWKSIWE